MIQLSLEEINALSPYEVFYAPNGDFMFATSLNIHYLISFEAEEPLGECDTYEALANGSYRHSAVGRCRSQYSLCNPAK